MTITKITIQTKYFNSSFLDLLFNKKKMHDIISIITIPSSLAHHMNPANTKERKTSLLSLLIIK